MRLPPVDLGGHDSCPVIPPIPHVLGELPSYAMPVVESVGLAHQRDAAGLLLVLTAALQRAGQHQST